MAKSNLEIVIGFLNGHITDLPDELKLLLTDSADCCCSIINYTTAIIDFSQNKKQFSGEFKLIADGKEIPFIKSVNPLTKTVRALDIKNGKALREKCGKISTLTFHPLKMKMIYDNIIVGEW